MGNVLICLDSEHEALLRRLSHEQYGGKKGSLSIVIQDALVNFEQKSKKISKDEFKKMLVTGINLDYKMYKSRSEVYD